MCYCKTPEQWDETVDVVIIGSGLAGLSAAIEAASVAESVLVLEKMPYYGGNSVLAGGGYACWDSKLKMRQKLDLGEDSSDSHFEDTLRSGGYYNDPKLVRTMVDGAPDGLDWLVSSGAQFKDVLAKIGGHSAPRSYQSACPGKPMMDFVKKRALDAGVELRLNSEVTGIFRDGACGEVCGVEIKRDGQPLRIRASRAVIIASGGFAGDVELRMEHNPVLDSSLPCSNHKGATGEVIRYAKSIGADALHMAFIQLYPCASPKSGSVDRWAFYAYSGTGFGMIYVDKRGRRFVRELAGRDEVSKAQMDTGHGCTWAVLNDGIVRALGMTDSEVALGLKLGRMIAADSLAELESKLNMPGAALTDTIDRINSALANGGPDPDFGGPRGSGMLALNDGPFYAIGQWPTVHYTMGGLRIDEEARVIDALRNPIPRLYSAGEVCGGIHGNNRIGGNSLAECVVFGRIAGKNAAAETA